MASRGNINHNHLVNADAGATLRIQFAEPPDNMPEIAKKLWRPMVDMLGRAGLLVSLDLFAMERLCLAYADYVEASEEIERNIIPIKNRGGKITEYRRSKYYTIVDKEGNTQWKRHPAAEDMADADRRMLSWLKEFGLTPSSRKSWMAPKMLNPLDGDLVGGSSAIADMPAAERATLRDLLKKEAKRQTQMARQESGPMAGQTIEEAEVVEG